MGKLQLQTFWYYDTDLIAENESLKVDLEEPEKENSFLSGEVKEN